MINEHEFSMNYLKPKHSLSRNLFVSQFLSWLFLPSSYTTQVHLYMCISFIMEEKDET